MVDRSSLVAGKLKALVDGKWGLDPERTRSSVPGAAILADNRTVWALFDQQPSTGPNKGPAGIGPLLAWAAKHDREISHLLADGLLCAFAPHSPLMRPLRAAGGRTIF